MINIAVLDADSAKELAEIEERCFSCPWSYESFLECLKNQRFVFLGAYEDGELVGYGGLLSVLDEGDIVNIATHPSHRRKGIARLLLLALKDAATERGVTRLHLEVREGNIPARRLYESFGFNYDGIRKNYYTKPNENAVLMTLVLENGKMEEL